MKKFLDFIYFWFPSIFIVFIFISMIGLLGYAIVRYEIPDPDPDLKYTIWRGSEFVAIGSQTDDYIKQDDFIIFVDRAGKEITVPLSQIWEIENNY